MFAVAAHCTFLPPKINVVGKCVLLTWPLAMIKLVEQRTELCISHISYSYNTMGRSCISSPEASFPNSICAKLRANQALGVKAIAMLDKTKDERIVFI